MLASFRLAIRYAIFAGFATVANIISQEIFIRLYDCDYALWVSILIGTAVGLVVKYILDKRYIFKFRPQSVVQNGKAFLLYALMGLITTAIFWGFEVAFDYIYQDKMMRYWGAVIGLSFGYFIKYQLDKKFVFRPRSR